MIKCVVLVGFLMTSLATSSVWAQTQLLSQPHEFESLRGLERFNKSDFLPSGPPPSDYLPPTPLDSTNQSTDTLLSIKDIKIGDNVLQQAIKLGQLKGDLGRIRGGTRSEKIKFSFYQPYENTQLKQTVELYFDKHNGFIKQVTATYFLQDAYLSIVPIREQALRAAVEKFGAPLTMQQAYDLSGQKEGEIKFEQFIKGLQQKNQLPLLGLEYFQKRDVSRSTKWVKGEQDYALMHSGFDRCYLWQTNKFSQILTFCFFDQRLRK